MRNKNKLVKQVILIILLGIFPLIGISQVQCFKIDSITVNYIPWELKTRLPLSSYDVKSMKNDNITKNKLLLTDEKILKEFLDLKLLDKEEINKTDIDVRMILDIFLEGGLTTSVEINSVGYYKYLDSVFYRNEKLNLWLKKYIGTSPISFKDAK